MPKPEKVSFDPKHTYYWVLDTNKGQMEIKLFPKVAPMHVTSTIYLTRMGFYDGVVFHRVIQGFMAQGGDPTGTGSGGPGYKYDGEFAPDGPSTTRRGCCRWRTRGPAPTAASSSSPSVPPRT